MARKMTSAERWTLLVAVAALGLSVFTFFDTRAQLRLASRQAKAYVQVLKAELVEPLETTSFVTLRLYLKNLGPTAAKNVRASMEYSDGMPGSSADRGSTAGDMGPGRERDLEIKSYRMVRSPWPRSDGRSPGRVFIFGSVYYLDESSGEPQHEDYCYQLLVRVPEDLRRTDLQQCGDYLDYKSSGNPNPEIRP